MKSKLEPLAAAFRYKIKDADGRVEFQDENSCICPAFVAAGTDEAFIYFTVRTTSWDFNGERTDIHDALSFFAAITLRALDVSCTLFDIPNDFTGIPTEIYGRYLTVDQPTRSIYKLDEHGIGQLKVLLHGVRFFESNLGTIFEWDPDLERMSEDLYGWDRATKAWASKVARAAGETLRSTKVMYNFRKNPHWFYYRTIAKSLSVYQSTKLARRMRELVNASEKVRRMPAATGTVYHSGASKNVVPHEAARVAADMLAQLEPRAPEPRLEFPIDSHFMAVGSKHVVAVRCDCSLKVFDREREHVRARRRIEDSVFFPGITFTWASKIDAQLFELLTRDLLAVEPGVQWVRTVGNTREGDEGRDLICEWTTVLSSAEKVQEKKPPMETRRVIVQCKASAKSVGKAKVQDVNDTVRSHGCNGYLLVVSSQLSVPLTRFLEGLRNGPEIWADWWTRSEIEERLRNRPEILARYADVVTVENRK